MGNIIISDFEVLSRKIWNPYLLLIWCCTAQSYSIVSNAKRKIHSHARIPSSQSRRWRRQWRHHAVHNAAEVREEFRYRQQSKREDETQWTRLVSQSAASRTAPPSLIGRLWMIDERCGWGRWFRFRPCICHGLHSHAPVYIRRDSWRPQLLLLSRGII